MMGKQVSEHETFPSFNMFPRDWIAGTATFTGEQKGWYIDLLCYAWEQTPPCTLPDDDGVLARLCGVSVQKWRRAGRVVRGKFDVIDGRLRNAKQFRVYSEMVENRERRRRAGQKGGQATRKRWEGNAPAKPPALPELPEARASRSLASSKEEAVNRRPTDASITDLTSRLLDRQGTDG